MNKAKDLLVSFYRNKFEFLRQENRELRSIIIDLQLENKLIRKLLLDDEKIKVVKKKEGKLEAKLK